MVDEGSLTRFNRNHEVSENGCWEWTAALKDNGYAAFQVMRNAEIVCRYGHRFAYEAFVGPIPEGLHLDHLCRNRACVNPEHLEPVSPAENCRRGMKGRMVTCCAKGHEYTPENTYIRPGNGRRDCRICRRLRKRKKVSA